MSQGIPDWVTAGKGIAPHLRWSFTTDAPLVCLDLSRETGELLATDSAGGLYRLDRGGKVLSLTRGLKDVRALAWSDTGNAGVVLFGEANVCRFNQKMELEWLVDFAEAALDVAIDPYGQYIAVSLANGITQIFDTNKKRVSRFETFRPLILLEFLLSEPSIVGASEYGLLCCHYLDGSKKWDERMLTNVGDISASGDGQTVTVAAFNRGLQVHESEQGTSLASYLIEGTASRVSTSFAAERMVASTLERHLYWFDSDGELLWATVTTDDICRLVCDPLGEWIVCGFASGRLLRLDWDSPNPA